jgi:hypothetical protein
MGVRGKGWITPLPVEDALEQRGPGPHFQGIHADLAMIGPAEPRACA